MTGVKRVSARARANRANARLSTCPRSAEGRARAARNALIHGLSAHPTKAADAAEVDRLARRIARESAGREDGEIISAARSISAAHMAAVAARRVRAALWRRIIEELKSAAAKFDASVGLVQIWSADPEQPAGSGRRDPLLQLLRLDRYEREALARRRRAVRVFMKLAQ